MTPLDLPFTAGCVYVVVGRAGIARRFEGHLFEDALACWRRTRGAILVKAFGEGGARFDAVIGEAVLVDGSRRDGVVIGWAGRHGAADQSVEPREWRVLVGTDVIVRTSVVSRADLRMRARRLVVALGRRKAS
ncbi:MAG: hypothetical protein KF850_22415 [Labilithrix sp.]|nr:hypothetical protein [Labilithrix sp.]